MFTIVKTTVVVVASLSAGGIAQAQSASPVAASSAAVAALLATPAQVVVIGHAPGGSELDAMRGEYRLSDGRVLGVARRGRALVAELGDMPAQRLHEAAPLIFRNHDGSLQVDFLAAGNGQVHRVVVSQR